MSGPEALLGTLLLLLLGPGVWQEAPGSVKSSRYVYTEVVVPRQLKSRDGFQKAHVSYILKVERKYQIVHLRHSTFVVPNMPVYSYNRKGDRIVDFPYIQDDCYYTGYIEDIADSWVVLSICNGLRGYLQIESFNYEINPIENSPAFQHIIYRRAQEGHHEPCRGIFAAEEEIWVDDFAQITAIDGGHPDPSDGEEDNLESHATDRYLEFYSVVDRSKAFTQRQNETQLVQNILLVMADIHSIFLEIGLHVYLVGLELWTERDPIAIGRTLPETLNEFQIYASYQLLHSIHFDHANLITTGGHQLGIASGEHFCQHSYASVSVVRSVGSLKSDVDQIAHELGHSLGFFHDDPDRHCDCNCVWKPGFCIMRSDYSAGGCRRLSNCSKHVYYDLIRKPGKECLLNKPKKVFRSAVCGDGIVDGNEQCDCGPDEECRSSGCCQMNCKLKPGADCFEGLCCEKCKYLPEGTMCRPDASECDLAEYCKGTAAGCPPDVFKQDGTPCGRRASCYTGQCLDLQQQCMALFGKDASLAPLSCFEEVNTRGDRSGNCGKEGQKFKKCKKQDVLCGRLQCVDVDKIPRLPTMQAVLQTPVERVMCWGTEFHAGLDAHDLGAVRDGTSCGHGKICLKRSCVSPDLEVLKDDCDLNRCHNRGVCNNRQNCHCTYGWAPPFCEGKGYGGSIDSGPPPVYSSNLALIIVVGTLIGVVLFAALVISVLKREQLKAWFAKSAEKPEPPAPPGTPEEPEDPTLEPEPLQEQQHASPVKRMLWQHMSPAKRPPRLELTARVPYPRQPLVPQPQPPSQGETRPQPQNPQQPQLLPPQEPRAQPQYPRQTQPAQPQGPRPKSPYPQPVPAPQPPYPVQPEFRPHLEKRKIRKPAKKPSQSSS